MTTPQSSPAPSTPLQVGQPAPWPAGITNQKGVPVSLAQHRGKHVLIYFYPKDDTPGCTKEACGFRDHIGEVGAVIYGVSMDTAASHQKFIDKFSLPFDLLVDPQKDLAKAFGVLAPGASSASRSSFLIGPDGRIKHIWPKVKPDEHWNEVKAAVAET
jgi:peroxiredoxin Q/BCP